MNNSIQKFEEGEFEPPKENKGEIPNGNGDEIKREENNNGLGELNPSTEAAEPTAGGSKCASASSPEERKAAIKKAHDLLVSIGIGTGAPCEECDDEDYTPRPPITSDTYDAPDSPVKTKGGKSTVTHPNEHPKPVNKCGEGCDGTVEEEPEAEIKKGAQKRPGANGGVSPSGKKPAPAEERAEAEAKFKKDQEKKFEDKKASEFGDVTGTYAHTKQIADRLKARYGKKTTKGEEHIPTWDEIRKSIANKESAKALGYNNYENVGELSNYRAGEALPGAIQTQANEMRRIVDEQSDEMHGSEKAAKENPVLAPANTVTDDIAYNEDEIHPQNDPANTHRYPGDNLSDASLKNALIDLIRQNVRLQQRLVEPMSTNIAQAHYEWNAYPRRIEESRHMNKGEEHIPTWEEIKKSIANRDTAGYLHEKYKPYPGYISERRNEKEGPHQPSIQSAIDALTSQQAEDQRIRAERQDTSEAGLDRGRQEAQAIIDQYKGKIPDEEIIEMLRKLQEHAAPTDFRATDEGLSPDEQYYRAMNYLGYVENMDGKYNDFFAGDRTGGPGEDPVVSAVRNNVHHQESLRNNRDERLDMGRSYGVGHRRSWFESDSEKEKKGKSEQTDSSSESTGSAKKSEDIHVPTWAEIRKAYQSTLTPAPVQTRLDATTKDAGYELGPVGSAFELRDPENKDIRDAKKQIEQRERTLAAQPNSPTAQKFYNDTIGKLRDTLANAKATRAHTVNAMAADPEKLAEAQKRNKAVAQELDGE